jgi:hypothetical protein
LWDKQVEELEAKIRERQAENPTAAIVATMPGAGAYSSLALACRIGSIERFPHARSLAHYWGLTPGCRNSGDATRRLGSITKQGSGLARFILSQMVVHVLHRDARIKEWYRRIKKRRGAKIARVAAMRRMATVLWHLINRREPYRPVEMSKTKAEDKYGVILPDRNAFFEELQGRSRETKQKGRRSPATAAAAAARP